MSERDYKRGKRAAYERVLDLIRREVPTTDRSWPAERHETFLALEQFAKQFGIHDLDENKHLGDTLKMIERHM